MDTAALVLPDPRAYAAAALPGQPALLLHSLTLARNTRSKPAISAQARATVRPV